MRTHKTAPPAPRPSMAPSLCPATVPLTPSAHLNGIWQPPPTACPTAAGAACEVPCPPVTASAAGALLFPRLPGLRAWAVCPWGGHGARCGREGALCEQTRRWVSPGLAENTVSRSTHRPPRLAPGVPLLRLALRRGLRPSTPPPPNRRLNSTDLADLFCQFVGFSEFRRFVLAICGVSVIWPIRSANLLGPLGF